MAFITADFVKERSTTTGTGDIALAGARSPAQTFSSVCSNGDQVHYAISHDTLNQWEVGVGTYNSGPNTITRNTVQASSNGGAAVNFSAGTKKVDLVLPAARIRNLVGPVQIGATSFGSGSLSFSNGNGVSFSLSTNSNGGTIHASHNGLTTVTVAATREIGVVSHVGVGSVGSVSRLAFSNASNLTWSLSTAASEATVLASVSPGFNQFEAAAFVSNSITTLTASSIFASDAVPVRFPELNTSNDSLFSYANVLWRFQTGAGSHSARQAAFQRYFGSGIVGGVSAQQVSFANGNNVTFGMTSSTFANFGVVPIYSASASDVRIGAISHVGGNAVAGPILLAFSDASNVTWSLSTAAGAATVMASVAAGGGGGITAFNITNAASSVAATILNLVNANGFSWLLNTAASVASLSASYTVPSVAGLLSAINVSAGTTSNNLSAITFSNSNNVSFGLNGSVVTATATVAAPAATREIGVVSHIGGNVVSSVATLAFSNASNVTWSLSTAAGAATVIGSVAAGGGGGATLSGYKPFHGELFAASFGSAGASGSFVFAPMDLPAAVQFDRFVHPISLSWATNSTHSHSLSLSFGIYTRNVSTLSLVTNATTSYAYTMSGTANSSLHRGWKLFTVPLTTTLAAGNYWLAFGSRLSTAGGLGTVINAMMSSSVPPDGGFGIFSAATNASVQIQLGRGGFSATTTTVPAAVTISQIIGSLSRNNRDPYILLGSGTA